MAGGRWRTASEKASPGNRQPATGNLCPPVRHHPDTAGWLRAGSNSHPGCAAATAPALPHLKFAANAGY
ncbi:MAG: hypothetical protein D8M54_20675 [Chloroflexi bacterium]|nr:hypothetical protein [Chloroflexota bacterium]